MNIYNESNVICSHHKIELFVLFHYLNCDLNTIKKICYENRININDSKKYNIDLTRLIDLPKFQMVFKSNIKTTKVWDRLLEETHCFFSSIKQYYNVDLYDLNEEQLLEFLFKYVNDFNSPKDLIKLNCFDLGARGFDINLSSINQMNKKLNRIKNQIIKENQNTILS